LLEKASQGPPADFRAALQTAAAEIVAQHSPQPDRPDQLRLELAKVFCGCGKAVCEAIADDLQILERLGSAVYQVRQCLHELSDRRSSFLRVPEIESLGINQLENALGTICSIATDPGWNVKQELNPYRAYSPGRPAGFRDYPWLATLVTHMQTSACTAGTHFSAYTKGGKGRPKEAAGSLPGALIIVRQHVAALPGYKFVARYLPTPLQHRRNVSTYRRLLAAARAGAVTAQFL
jgi:hypothetical protein